MGFLQGYVCAIREPCGLGFKVMGIQWVRDRSCAGVPEVDRPMHFLSGQLITLMIKHC